LATLNNTAAKPVTATDITVFEEIKYIKSISKITGSQLRKRFSPLVSVILFKTSDIPLGWSHSINNVRKREAKNISAAETGLFKLIGSRKNFFILLIAFIVNSSHPIVVYIFFILLYMLILTVYSIIMAETIENM
jgi:hypothetical protein